MLASTLFRQCCAGAYLTNKITVTRMKYEIQISQFISFQNPAQGKFVHYITAFEIKGIGKKLPYAISFPSPNVAMATRHPCLAPPLFQLPMLRLLSLTPKTAFLKHFQLLYAVEFLLYLGLILSDVVYNSEFLGFRGK